MNSLRCRACGSTDLVHRGTKAGTFLRRDFAFHQCRICELMFVEPFSGFAIYDDAYYRGQGPDRDTAQGDHDVPQHLHDPSSRTRPAAAGSIHYG